MGFTHFPNGLTSMGVPVLGGTSAFGWSSQSSIYFVDGTNGSDSNDGSIPERAFATIGKALGVANKWDVVYVIPRDWTSGNMWLGTAYRETSTDLSITYAKQGLALIGVGHQGLVSSPYGTVIQQLTGTTTATLSVYAPMCVIENLAFYDSTGTQVKNVLFQSGTDGTYEADLSTIYNCHFHGGGYGNSVGAGGGIFSDQCWGITVDSCTFMGVKMGVMIQSGAGTAGKIVVRNNEFYSRQADAASDINIDICGYCQGSSTWLVENNRIGHLIPSAGNTNIWINLSDVREGLVSNNHFGGVVGVTYTQGYNGTGISVAANVGLGANYCNGQLMPTVAA